MKGAWNNNPTAVSRASFRRRITVYYFVFMLIFTGYNFFSFEITPVLAQGPEDYTIPEGDVFYLDDLVTYSNGSVTNDTNVFIVHSNITLPWNSTLKINSSTVLKFNTGKSMFVWGKLIIDGQPGSHVYVTSNSSQPFKGIRILSNTTTSYINNTIINNATEPLVLINTTLELLNITIDTSAENAISIYNSTFVFNDGLVNGSGTGILGDMVNDITIKNVTFSNLAAGIQINDFLLNATLDIMDINMYNITSRGLQTNSNFNYSILISTLNISDAGHGLSLIGGNFTMANSTVTGKGDGMGMEVQDLIAMAGFNISIEGFDTGVQAKNISWCHIDMITLQNLTNGVLLKEMNNTGISNVTISQISSAGIGVNASREINLLGLDISDCPFGVHFKSSININIGNAVIGDTQYGIAFLDSEGINLEEIDIDDATFSGIHIQNSSVEAWMGISINNTSDGIIGERVTDFYIEQFHSVFITNCSNYGYEFFNSSMINISGQSLWNDIGGGVHYKNVSSINIMDMEVYTPLSYPVNINNTLSPLAQANIQDSHILNGSGGILLRGNMTDRTSVRITNTTFSDYGEEYLNATNANITSLNSTFVQEEIWLNYSNMYIEFFLNADISNLCGTDLLMNNITVIASDNITKQVYPGNNLGEYRWLNITFGMINATNTTNYTFYSPLTVHPQEIGYEGDNETISQFQNHHLSFSMRDIMAPMTEYMIKHFVGTVTYILNETSTISLIADDTGGCGGCTIFYNINWSQGETGIMPYAGNITPYNSSGEVEGNYTMEFYSRDSAGNTEETQILHLYVDTSPPLLNDVDIKDGYRDDIAHIWNLSSTSEITLNYTDVSDILYYWYYINGIYYQSPFPTFIIASEFMGIPDGTYTIMFGAMDNLGHNTTGANITIVLDNTAPEVIEWFSHSIVDLDDSQFFVANSTVFNLTGTDALCGLKRIYFRLDGYDYDYTVNLTIGDMVSGMDIGDREGAHILLIGAEDNLGNMGFSEYVRPTNKFILDTTAPVVVKSIVGETHEFAETGFLHIRPSGAILLSSSDLEDENPQCGVLKTWYSVDGQYSEGELIDLERMEAGLRNITIGAEDNLGNNGTSEEFSIIIDEDTPLPPAFELSTNLTRFENLLIEGVIPLDSILTVIVNYDYDNPYTAAPDSRAGGQFSIYVVLQLGENTIIAQLEDPFGRTSQWSDPQKAVLDQDAPVIVGTVPEMNETDVSIQTPIEIEFDESVSDVTIELFYRYRSQGSPSTWEVVDGSTVYSSGDTSVFFIPDSPLQKEVGYRVETTVKDIAGNFGDVYLFDRFDSSSYSFKTEPKQHNYLETKYLGIHILKIDYSRVGEAIPHNQLITELDVPHSPPADNLTLDVYFSVNFDLAVSVADIILDYELRQTSSDNDIYDKYQLGLCDLGELTFFYINNGTWKELNTLHEVDGEIKYQWDSQTGYSLVMGVFVRDLDWDGDQYRNEDDLYPRNPNEWMDADGDGFGDNIADRFPGNMDYWADSDDDGLPDNWERIFGLDPKDSGDGIEDLDGDGMPNNKEFLNSTYPNNYDSDNDSIPDGWEWNNGFDPLDSSDSLLDSDGDGATNLEEYLSGRNPNVSDVPKEKKEGTDPVAVTLIVLSIITLLAVLVYTLITRKKRMSVMKQESGPKYFRLEDLGEIEYPEDISWGGGRIRHDQKPLEVYDLDYLKNIGITTGEDIYGRPKDVSGRQVPYPYRVRGPARAYFDDDDIFTAPIFECSNCGETVGIDDKECDGCGREFQEDIEPEKGLEKEELEKLLSALESFTCSECGEEVGLDDNKCPECDSVFAGADEMVCSGCVAVVKGNAESCPECEAEFE